MTRAIRVCGILFLLFLSACSRAPQTKSEEATTSAAMPPAGRAAIPLPAGFRVTRLAESSDEKAIAFAYDDAQQECVAVIAEAPPAQLRRIFCGKSVYDLGAAPANGIFSASVVADNGLLIFFDSAGRELSRIPHSSYEAVGPIWSADAQKAFFQTDKPGVTDDQTGGMEFTAIGDVAPRTGKITIHPLRKMAVYLGYSPATRELLATHGFNENSPEAPADAYRETGEYAGARKLHAAQFSSAGHYATPHLHEALSWQVYGEPQDTPVLDFRCNYKSDPHVIEMFQSWHPTVDRYLFNLHQTEPANGNPSDDNTIQLWDVESGKVLKSFHEQPFAAARDGKHLIFFRDGKFVFDPI